MKLLGINNLKKQNGIRKKSNKSNTKSKLIKKGGAGEKYTIYKLRNTGVPTGEGEGGMRMQCFWISLSQGLEKKDIKNDDGRLYTVTELRNIINERINERINGRINGRINRDDEQFDTATYWGALQEVYNFLISKELELYFISSSYKSHVNDLLIEINRRGNRRENVIIIYHTPGHFELVTRITNSEGNLLYNIYEGEGAEEGAEEGEEGERVYDENKDLKELKKLTEADINLIKDLIGQSTILQYVSLKEMIDRVNDKTEKVNLQYLLNKRINELLDKDKTIRPASESGKFFKTQLNKQKEIFEKDIQVQIDKITNAAYEKINNNTKKIKTIKTEELDKLYKETNTNIKKLIEEIKASLNPSSSSIPS